MVVAPEQRRAGIGRELLKAAEDFARKQGGQVRVCTALALALLQTCYTHPPACPVPSHPCVTEGNRVRWDRGRTHRRVDPNYPFVYCVSYSELSTTSLVGLGT